jgi:hypothetical protein
MSGLWIRSYWREDQVRFMSRSERCWLVSMHGWLGIDNEPQYMVDVGKLRQFGENDSGALCLNIRATLAETTNARERAKLEENLRILQPEADAYDAAFDAAIRRIHFWRFGVPHGALLADHSCLRFANCDLVNPLNCENWFNLCDAHHPPLLTVISD